MKHKVTITLILLTMFLVTQFIGLFVVNAYTPIEITDPLTNQTNISTANQLPYGLEPEEQEDLNILDIVISFALAFTIIFLLIKYKWRKFMRTWFLLVTIIAIAISLTAILRYTSIPNAAIVALIITVPLATFKIFKPNAYIHNITELLIYPGIATIFVPILTTTSIIILLVIISIYDIWAVWKSGIMQKMAKFQMEELKIFGGFLITSASKKTREKIKLLKQKYKGKKIPAKVKKQKFKVSIAILGGGDVVFPIITAGVFMRVYGIIPALFIIFGALFGLSLIFMTSEKKKSYPAMPYISSGIFIALILWRISVYLITKVLL